MQEEELCPHLRACPHRQGSQEDSSRNKRAGRHHLPPLPHCGTSAALTFTTSLAYTNPSAPTNPTLWQIYPSQSLLLQSQSHRSPPSQDQCKPCQSTYPDQHALRGLSAGGGCSLQQKFKVHLVKTTHPGHTAHC